MLNDLSIKHIGKHGEFVPQYCAVSGKTLSAKATYHDLGSGYYCGVMPFYQLDDETRKALLKLIPETTAKEAPAKAARAKSDKAEESEA